MYSMCVCLRAFMRVHTCCGIWEISSLIQSLVKVCACVFTARWVIASAKENTHGTPGIAHMRTHPQTCLNGGLGLNWWKITGLFGNRASQVWSTNCTRWNFAYRPDKCLIRTTLWSLFNSYHPAFLLAVSLSVCLSVFLCTPNFHMHRSAHRQPRL